MGNYHPFRHFITITKHRHQVIRNGFHMGIGFHCLFHDLSKYSWEEFNTSAHNYIGTSSPVYQERLDNGYTSTICLHHTGRNKHHWEYWADFFKGYIVAKAMPFIYACEYICDVLAASKTYDPKHFTGKEAAEYFRVRMNHYYIEEGTKEFVLWGLEEYAQNGWKNLGKRKAKAKYDEIMAKHSGVTIYDKMIYEEKIVAPGMDC